VNVFFERFGSLREALGLAENFPEVKVGKRLVGSQTPGMQQRGFGSRKIPEGDAGSAEKEERI